MANSTRSADMSRQHLCQTEIKTELAMNQLRSVKAIGSCFNRK